MIKKRKIVRVELVLCLILLLCSVSLAWAKIVAVVEGVPITDIDVKKEVAQQAGQRGQENLKKQYRQALEGLIQQELLFKEAKSENLTVAHKDRERALESIISKFPSKEVFIEALSQEGMSYDEFVDSIEKKILISQICQRYLSLNLFINTQTIEEYYQKNKKDFYEEKQVSIKQIYIPFGNDTEKNFARSQIENAYQTLISREGNFEDVIQEDSKLKISDLGFVIKGQLSEKLDEVALRLNLGEISSVIEGEQGYHILKVEAIKEEKVPTFDEVKAIIKEKLWNQKEKELIDKLVESIRQKSYVELKS